MMSLTWSIVLVFYSGIVSFQHVPVVAWLLLIPFTFGDLVAYGREVQREQREREHEKRKHRSEFSNSN